MISRPAAGPTGGAGASRNQSKPIAGWLRIYYVWMTEGQGRRRSRGSGSASGDASQTPGPGAARRGDELGALLALVARGDHGAYKAVFDRTASQVLGTVLAVVRDPAQSEEVDHELMLDDCRSVSRHDANIDSAA